MRSVADLVEDIVPSRFAGRTLADYDPKTTSQTEALEAALHLAEFSILNLVLVGPPGLGKTHLAAAVVNARVAAAAEHHAALVTKWETERPGWAPAFAPLPLWINVADAMSSMRFEMDAPLDDRDMTEKVRRARSHQGLVVLDDLGREKVTNWTGELVYAVVNARYEAQLGTIVTSNLTPVELAASPYWPAISRLAEDGELVKLDGSDHRLTT